MILNTREAPHIRHYDSARGLMTNALLAVLFLYVMAVFYYGPRVVALAAASVLTALVCDILCTLAFGRRPSPRDLSPYVTGLLLPLLMPASVSYPIVIAAAAFGIVVAKQPFGGVGHNVFNPAAAGFCFAAICFPDKLFTYPTPMTYLPVFGPLNVSLQTGPEFTLSLGGLPGYDLVEMLRGNYPGPMGATNILVILACLLYLIFRNVIRWQLPVCFFATTALLIIVFPRGGVELGLDLAMRVRLMFYEMMSGAFLLSGVFLLGDPVTTPKRGVSRAAFGVGAGIAALLFRRYGGVEVSLPFTVLLMNATVWGFDMAGERFICRFRRRKRA